MLQTVKDYINIQQNSSTTFDQLFINYLIKCQDRGINQEYTSTLNNRGIDSLQAILDTLINEMADIVD